MNGRSLTFALFTLAGLAAAYWLWTRASGAGGAASAGTATGNASADGASSTAALDSAGGNSGLTWAQSLGVSMGVYTPRGIRNNNPGNLMYSPNVPWEGQVGPDAQGYAVFSDPSYGVRAMAHQLLDYYNRGLVTLNEFIPVYAPAQTNDTAAYVADVAARLGVDPNAPLDVPNMLPEIIAAMIQHEDGEDPYTAANLQQWAYMA